MLYGYVYRLINTVDGKCYVGSTKHLRTRKNFHLWELRNNRHHCRHLQQSWNKYGEDVWRFEILEERYFENDAALRKREEEWFSSFAGLLLNSTLLTQVVKGGPPSLETRMKLSKALRGRKFSEETIRRMSEAQRQRPMSTRESSIQAMLASRRGTPLTPEHGAKIGEANRRRRLSITSKNKISSSRRGVLHSEETKERQRQSQIGKKHSDATKAKMRQAHIGRPKDPVAVARQAASLSGRPNGALLIAPDGTIYRVINGTAFAREHNLHPTSVSDIITGRRKSTKGWRRYDGPVPEELRPNPQTEIDNLPNNDVTLFNLQGPDGTIYWDIPNLKAFCREHNLIYQNIGAVMRGEVRQTRDGWTRYDGPPPVDDGGQD